MLKKYPQSIHFHKIWGKKLTKFKVEKVTKINLKTISKPHALLQTLEKTCAKFQKDWYKIVWGVAITRYPLSTSEVRKWQSSQSRKKWQKLMQGLYQKHMHIFRLWRKHGQSFKKIGIKLYEELCSRGIHCLYTEGEKWLSSQYGKSDKKWSNHYIQNICISSYNEENTCKVSKWSVQNCKRSCAHKRYPWSTYWGWKMTKFTMWKKWQKII